METKGNRWEIITLYDSVINTNERGPTQVIGTFSNELTAKEFAKGKGWYGANGWAEKITAVRLYQAEGGQGGRDLIFNTVYKMSSIPLDVDRYEKVRKENRRQELISSLSDEDLEILGVKK